MGVLPPSFSIAFIGGKILNFKVVKCPDMKEIVQMDIFCNDCEYFNGVYREGKLSFVDCGFHNKGVEIK